MNSRPGDISKAAFARQPPAPTFGARLHQANAAATAYYADQLTGHQAALDYLRSRGIERAAIPCAPWQLGYAPPGRQSLIRHLRLRGFTSDDLGSAGLVVRGRDGHLVDRFRDRLTFPIHDQNGQVVGFTARDLSGRSRAKYLNTPETPIYRKGRLLYGLGLPPSNEAVGGMPLVFVVEGAADVIAVRTMTDTLPAGGGIGPIWVVSPCGTALTGHQLASLAEATPTGTRLAVAFDADDAGNRALDRAYPLLRRWPGKAYAILLPAGSDPADVLAFNGPADGMRELAGRFQPVARAALANSIDRLFAEGRITKPDEYVEDRVFAYRAVADYFIDDPDDTVELARTVARRLGVDGTDVVRGVIESAMPDGPAPAGPDKVVSAETEQHGQRATPTSKTAEPATPSAVRWASASRQGHRRWQADSVASHIDPATGRQAWALADGIGDRAEAAYAATTAAQVAARQAAACGAVAGVCAARTALNSQDLDRGGDAALIVAVAAPAASETGSEIAWVGNARAYTLQEGHLLQVTVDHTVAQERRDAGHLVVAHSDLEHLLTASTREGPIGRVELDPQSAPVLLCTSGLYRNIEPIHLQQALGPARDPQASIDRIATSGSGAGGDNATIVLLHGLVPRPGGPAPRQVQLAATAGAVTSKYMGADKSTLVPLPTVRSSRPYAPRPREAAIAHLRVTTVADSDPAVMTATPRDAGGRKTR